jgi:hypothetical protein
MAKPYRQAQDLTRGVYLTARQQVLRSIGNTVEQLDALYAGDAERLKRELTKLLRLSGFPQRRAAQIIDSVLAGSRAQRVEIVRKAVENAARVGRKLDKATFDTVFGKDKDAALPLGKGRSGSRPIGTPLRLRANESGEGSSSTD